jgi:hypothetical protein
MASSTFVRVARPQAQLASTPSSAAAAAAPTVAGSQQPNVMSMVLNTSMGLPLSMQSTAIVSRPFNATQYRIGPVMQAAVLGQSKASETVNLMKKTNEDVMDGLGSQAEDFLKKQGSTTPQSTSVSGAEHVIM